MHCVISSPKLFCPSHCVPARNCQSGECSNSAAELALSRDRIPPSAFTCKARPAKGGYLLRQPISIFVEDNAINHHVVARAHIVDMNGHADFDACPDRLFIKRFAALGHIGNSLAEPITAWPLVSFKTMALPGVNSVIVPPPSVVVVVEVVVSETWAHANGAAAATAMLSSSFFIFWLSCLVCEQARYAPRKRS